MDKELALAIDFKKAPVELQNLATAHHTNIKALAKATNAKVKAEADLEQAKRLHDETAKALRVALKSWTPEV